MSNVFFVLAIFVSIWMGSIIITKMIYKDAIQWWNFILFSIGLTAVITHIAGIW